VKPILTYVTCKNTAEDRKIATAVVKGKLASCANIIPTIESVYSWNGELHNDTETLLLLKTFDTLFPKIEKTIKTLHSYETPCIIAIPVTHASKDYVAWSRRMTT